MMTVYRELSVEQKMSSVSDAICTAEGQLKGMHGWTVRSRADQEQIKS